MLQDQGCPLTVPQLQELVELVVFKLVLFEVVEVEVVEMELVLAKIEEDIKSVLVDVVELEVVLG